MSNHILPGQFNPEKFCRAAPAGGQLCEGTVTLGEIPELAPELASQAATPIHIKMNFEVDEHEYCVVKGELSVTLAGICQRCLKPFTYPVTSQFVVSPVTNDEDAKTLPERYEPLLVTEGEINLATWIAEELYLALPFAPRHEPSCISYANNNDEAEDQQDKKPSPFAALKGKV